MREPQGKHLADEVISSYIDGALAPNETAAVRRHLAECGVCAANLRTMRETVLLLKELPQVACPRSFIIREADVMPQRPRPSGLFVFLRSATAAVAILLAAVLAGDLILRQAVPSPLAMPQTAVVREAAPAAPSADQQLSVPTVPADTGAAAKLAAAPSPEMTQAATLSRAGTKGTPPTPTAIALPTHVVEKAVVATQPPAATAVPASAQPAAAPTLTPAQPRTAVAALAAPSVTPTPAGSERAASTELVEPSATATSDGATLTANAAETATAIAELTPPPVGFGGGEPGAGTPTPTPTYRPPTATSTPAPSATPTPLPPTPTRTVTATAPPTLAPTVAPTPTAVPATAVAVAAVPPPAPTQAPADASLYATPSPAASWGPLFRLAEIALLFIVLGLGALTLVSRPKR